MVDEAIVNTESCLNDCRRWFGCYDSGSCTGQDRHDRVQDMTMTMAVGRRLCGSSVHLPFLSAMRGPSFPKFGISANGG